MTQSNSRNSILRIAPHANRLRLPSHTSHSLHPRSLGIAVDQPTNNRKPTGRQRINNCICETSMLDDHFMRRGWAFDQRRSKPIEGSFVLSSERKRCSKNMGSCQGSACGLKSRPRTPTGRVLMCSEAQLPKRHDWISDIATVDSNLQNDSTGASPYLCFGPRLCPPI